MKKVIGVIKSKYSTNCFVDVVFEDKGDNENYFLQVVENNEIDFLKFKKNNDLVSLINYDCDKFIGDELIFSFLKEDETILIGRLSEIKDELIKVLNDKKVPPMAKIEIANEMELWGLSKRYHNESIDYFKNRSKNNVDFSQLTPNLNRIENFIIDLESINNFVPKIISFYDDIISKNNSLSWKDTFVMKDNGNVVTIGNIDTATSLLFDKVMLLGKDDLAKKIAEVGSPLRSFYLENESINKVDNGVSPNEYEKIREIAEFIKNK